MSVLSSTQFSISLTLSHYFSLSLNLSLSLSLFITISINPSFYLYISLFFSHPYSCIHIGAHSHKVANHCSSVYLRICTSCRGTKLLCAFFCYVSRSEQCMHRTCVTNICFDISYMANIYCCVYVHAYKLFKFFRSPQLWYPVSNHHT